MADTLGDEAQGMVVLDYDGHPQKYDQVEILAGLVAKEVNVLKVLQFIQMVFINM